MSHMNADAITILVKQEINDAEVVAQDWCAFKGYQLESFRILDSGEIEINTDVGKFRLEESLLSDIYIGIKRMENGFFKCVSVSNM